MRGWRTMNAERTGGSGLRTRKRFAWGLAAAIAAGVTVAMPDGPTTTPAYALEKNADGTLTFSVRDLDWHGEPERFERLAEKIRAAGFTAVVDKVPPGKRCGLDRGKPLQQRNVGDGKWSYQYVMTPAGAFLVEENLPGAAPKGSDWESPRSFRYAFIKDRFKPCDPVDTRSPPNPPR